MVPRVVPSRTSSGGSGAAYTIVPFLPPDFESVSSQVADLNETGQAVGKAELDGTAAGDRAVHLDIATGDCGSGAITAAEYFFDVDPGAGNGTALTGPFGTAEVTLDLSGIDTSGLGVGYHTLFARFKSSDGVWGIARPIGHDPSFTSPHY